MKEIERIGLLKMDFLGLSTLTLIFDAIAEIKRTTGVELDIDALPLDDPKTYQIFQEGRPTASSSSRAAGCATSCARPSRSASTT
jgi:DNA polymerase-3 subunit alpha